MFWLNDTDIDRFWFSSICTRCSIKSDWHLKYQRLLEWRLTCTEPKIVCNSFVSVYWKCCLDMNHKSYRKTLTQSLTQTPRNFHNARSRLLFFCEFEGFPRACLLFLKFCIKKAWKVLLAWLYFEPCSEIGHENKYLVRPLAWLSVVSTDRDWTSGKAKYQGVSTTRTGLKMILSVHMASENSNWPKQPVDHVCCILWKRNIQQGHWVQLPLGLTWAL